MLTIVALQMSRDFELQEVKLHKHGALDGAAASHGDSGNNSKTTHQEY